MTASDLFDLVIRVNLALSAAIGLVLVIRAPARKLFGARAAYALWIIPALAAASCFLPARVEYITLAAPLAPAPAAAQPALVGPPLWLALWYLGALLSALVLVVRQTSFMSGLGGLRPRSDLGRRIFSAGVTSAGPAVLGVFNPRIVMPADFDARYSAEERRAIIAHEHAHIAHGDPIINAAVALVRCINWFNPLVHVAAHALRTDQELACDAAVIEHAVKRTYAEALLKSQIALQAPLSCAWPSDSHTSLKERIAMLKQTLPTRARRFAGISLVAFAAAGVSAATWAAQPARVVATAPTIAPAQPLGIQAVRPVTTLAPTIDAVLAPVTTQPVALDGDDEVLEGGSGAAQRYQLSPEEREQIRAAIAEGSAARAEAIARAQAEIAAAMAEVDDSDLEGGLAAQTHALLADTMRLVQSDQLTAADHAEIRAALAARREDIRAAAEAARSAQIEAARDAAREANRADREAEREAAFAAREAAREAALEARDAARETRDAAREAAQDARDSAREAAREAREACVENRDACERDD